MAMRIRHIKGFNGGVAGGLAAHPSERVMYYVVGSSVLAVFEGDPTKQVQLRGHDDELTAFAMSPRGTFLATGQRGANSDVVIWDARGLAQKHRFQEHNFEVCALAFSSDERLLATVGNERERRVFVLDTATGKIVSNTTLLEPKARRRTRALAWSPACGPCYVFASAADMDLYLYTLDPFKGWVNCEKVVTGSVRKAVHALCFSADGAWLFAGTASGDVLSINVARRAVQVRQGAPAAAARRRRTTPRDAERAALRVRGRSQVMHQVASAGVSALLLAPDGRRLLVGALDSSLSLFDPRGEGPHTAPPLAAVPGAIVALSAAAGGGLLVGTQQGDISLVPAAGGRVAPVLQSQRGALRDLVWAPCGGSLATASASGTVCVWDAATLGLECRAALHNTDAAAQSVALSPDGALLVSGWSDGDIHCHGRGGAQGGAGGAPGAPARPAPGAAAHAPGAALWCIPQAHATAHSAGVPALQVSHRGHFIASGGAGGEVRVWDVASRELVSHLKHHVMPITDLKVSVVSVGLDRAVSVWDLRCDAAVRVVQDAHQHEITCVAVNHAGTLIATGGADCAVF
ncbi:CFAP52 [Scenedesmus sp. PABB004]|nr:CFAP52 [Scenedesmus sp. PABB004]